ncbi:predicted protein [Nematostella vectensis]|uniref:UDP-glucuronosyltransferase n=2 Tax=Nematostella vectensis TaxID=45351 RepID=A7RUX5_NEMVE|nr:predicted protein [Nematostella vectensis]|eukprot:XP_001636889.1 predicted protein [Nematostella vectensis]
MAARAAFCTAVFQSIAILLMSQSSSSAKIAVLVIPNGISHFYMMEPIGQELEARGHEVTYIMCSMEPKLYTINARRILIYDVKHPVNALVEASALKLARTGSLSWPNAVKVLDILSDACDTVLSNQTILSALKGTDLLFGDSSIFGCSQLLQLKTGIPHIVDFLAWGFNDPFVAAYGVDWPLSYIPSEISFSSPRMTFMKRVENVMFYLFMQIIVPLLRSRVTGRLQHKHGIAADKSVAELLGDTDIVLAPADWSLEWARPLPPNVKVIGSPSQRQAMKLPREFEDFIASAEHGVVLVSFGSMVMSLDDAVVSKLANVFSKLKYKVIIKFGDSFPKTDNVMLVKWMPQNDILANSNVKLFITHGGANSVYEGCGHGVPLLVTPLFSDQFGYGEKVKAAGLGISVSLKESTAEEMIKNINELIEKPCYKENALRVSRLMEDKPQTPQQEGAFWIEYVIRNNGTQHLRPSGRDLPFYQYFLLDVMLFFGTIISIFVFMLVKCLKVVRFKSGLSTVKRKEE